MESDVEDEAAHDEDSDERGAAVGDERERHARKRDDAEHGADVDECLRDDEE